MYGTVLSIASLHVVAFLGGAWTTLPAALHTFLIALLPAVSINVFIVGLNQLCDIEIDRVNKPRLPLPSGDLTRSSAVTIITVALLIGVAFCFAPGCSVVLRTVLLGSAVLGALYSAPPIRLKRFALIASICILTVRGILVNIGFFLHALRSNSIANISPVIRFATAFFVIFGIVIALLKDVPDIKGDRIFGVRTFSVRLGARSVFVACTATLCTAFIIGAAFFLCTTPSAAGVLAALLHISTAAEIARRARKVNPVNPKQAYDFYMFTWKAFYLEYLLLPFGA